MGGFTLHGQGDLQGQQERVRQSYANNGIATAFRSVLMYRMDVFSVDYENTKVNQTDLVYAQYTYSAKAVGQATSKRW